MSEPTILVILCTVDTEKEGQAIAQALVQREEAACVNIVPQVHSVYRWKDKIQRDTEQLLLIKTVESQIDDLRDALFSMHPYEVPEFVVIRMDDLSSAYREWLISSL